MSVQTRVRCRPIVAADLEGVATLLARGFPGRPYAYWKAGLDLMARRPVPETYPRFGFLLETEGQPVGVILVIAQEITHDGEPFVRCNLSSWYVEAAFRSHAAALSSVPLRAKAATIVNISAAPNTWPTIEALGFKRYSWGQRVALPLLHKGEGGLRVEPFGPAHVGELAEGRLLADHAAMRCICLIGRAPEGPVPFVFSPLRIKQGRTWLPCSQVVFCRATADLARFARPLGRALMARGLPFVVFDDTPEGASLPGAFFPKRARKYVRGGRQPRLGDLAYTEIAVFGP